MSERGTVGKDAAASSFMKDVVARLTALEQRPQGGPNGLIAPGGATALGWQAIAGYTGTWGPAPAGAAPNRQPQYALDADGWVHLRGSISNTVNWPTGVAFTLPAGYRPSATEFFITATLGQTLGAANGAATWEVANDGTCDLNGVQNAVYSGTNWISLSGIHFYVGGQ